MNHKIGVIIKIKCLNSGKRKFTETVFSFVNHHFTGSSIYEGTIKTKI